MQPKGRAGRRRAACGTALALAAGTLAACGAPAAPAPSSSAPSASPSTPDGGVTTVPPSNREDAATVVVTGLEAPWSIAFAGDVPLVSERGSGRIRELVAGGLRTVGTIPGVTARGEGGLLGIAVRDDVLYAAFTADAENRIERFPLRGGPGSLALGEGEEIVAGIPSGATHNGGRIAFGPDGMLYATTGDAGERENAQDLDSLAGKILRMTPDGKAPGDNPFPGSLVYSYGHRNPQGIAWGPDGTMYASEFGQSTWDELNVIEPGANYGWPEVEGIAGRRGFVDPVQQWRPAEASPSGIAIAGDVLRIANLRGERVREIPLADPSRSIERAVEEYGRLRDVAVAPDGSVWLLTNNTDGRGTPREGDDRIVRMPEE